MRRAGAVAASAAAALLAVLALFLVLRPDLDPTWTFLSEYAVGDTGWLMTVGFLCGAVACLGTAVIGWVTGRVLGRIGAVLAGVSAIGFALAGLFPADPAVDGPVETTAAGALHALGASLNLTPIAVLLITIALWRRPSWRSRRLALALLAGLTLASDVAFIAFAAAAGGEFGPGTFAGLAGRIAVAAFAAWVVVAGVRLRTGPSGHPAV
ncbi:hypothetical protein GCM10017608_14740 [Agromyces luteolus]|nr:hypothetical protein GCM10017608_14740 [Agromyces luteolus]